MIDILLGLRPVPPVSGARSVQLEPAEETRMRTQKNLKAARFNLAQGDYTQGRVAIRRERKAKIVALIQAQGRVDYAGVRHLFPGVAKPTCYFYMRDLVADGTLVVERLNGFNFWRLA